MFLSFILRRRRIEANRFELISLTSVLLSPDNDPFGIDAELTSWD